MTIDRIEAKYRVLTPMFCGGARPVEAELRLATFKGVLRWWWRALAWSRYKPDLAKIKSAEDTLFGSTETGQSRVVMRLLAPSELKTLKPREVLRCNSGANAPVAGEGARYLGYGVMEAFARKVKGQGPAVQAGELTRGCVVAPFDFTIELRCRDLDDLPSAVLLDALRALGLLGGMGAKSRKGYGSLVLKELVRNGSSCRPPPKDLSGLADAIKQLYPNPAADGLPPYTALSKSSRHVLLTARDGAEPLALLDHVGREIVRYRSWGHNGKVLGEDSEKNFKDDHDLMKLPAGQRFAHPRRIVFGLPHNYGKAGDQQVKPAGGLDRRASPLLIHIHECGTSPVAVISFLPAEFLPGGADAKIDVGGAPIKLAGYEQLRQPIVTLLDRFLGSSQRKEPFGEAQDVRPP